MAKHVFVITVAEDQEPLTLAGAQGLEAALTTTEAVTNAEYRGKLNTVVDPVAYAEGASGVRDENGEKV